MPSRFEFDGINWEGRGYFGCPTPPPGAKLSGRPEDDPWLTWVILLDEAKRGRFGNLPVLAALQEDTIDPVFDQLCFELIGDAGPEACYAPADEWLASPDLDLVLLCAGALAERGRLADVPRLVEVACTHADESDAAVVPFFLADVLGEGVPPSIRESGSNGFRTTVLGLFEARREELGADDVSLFRGEVFGVNRLARRMLVALEAGRFNWTLRRRFEAATGIDCTPFYEDEELRPLAAAGILEDFLDGPDAARYEDGVRYFFGHRIPD
jgi:hypothetical protein